MHDLLTPAMIVGWPALFGGAFCILAYRRASLAVSPGVLLVLLAGYWVLGAAPVWWKVLASVPFAILLLLNVRTLRIRLLTRPFMKKYRKLLPAMSSTESEALDAGTVWWDGELFTGGPDWPKLMSSKAPVLTPAEQRSEEHTSELQSHLNLVCRLLLEKKKNIYRTSS